MVTLLSPEDPLSSELSLLSSRNERNASCRKDKKSCHTTLSLRLDFSDAWNDKRTNYGHRWNLEISKGFHS